MTRHRNNHVSPSEIEAVLNGHPSVSDSAVFGVPHPEVMEVVRAVAAVNGEDVIILLVEELPQEADFTKKNTTGHRRRTERLRQFESVRRL